LGLRLYVSTSKRRKYFPHPSNSSFARSHTAAQFGPHNAIWNWRLRPEGHDIDANDFEVRAERLVGDASHVLYAFSIRAGERLLLEGRSVALSAGSLTPTRHCGAAAALSKPHLPVR
jgi:hypothetical protein